MTGYVILGAFVFFAVSVLGVYLYGRHKGRKEVEAEFCKELSRKAEKEIAFEQEKAEIREEVFGNAEQQKASLSGGAPRARFERANDVLRGNAAN